MKKTLFITILFTPFIALADASNTITLDPSFNISVWAQAQSLFNGFSGYISMIVGVILAAVVLEIVIGAIRK